MCPTAFVLQKEGLIVFFSVALSDEYVREVVSDRLRQAERDRLADLAAGPSRPVRARVAGWLFAIARRIEGQPQATLVRAEA